MALLPSSPPAADSDASILTEDLAQRRRTARNILAAGGLVGVLTWIAILVGSMRKTPGLDGVLTGVFVGLFIALLVTGGGAWLAIRVMFPPKPPSAPDLAAGDAIATSLADILSELETSRRETVRQINARATWRVPLCVALGLAMWIYGQYSADPGDPGDLVALVIVPGLGGYVWASLHLSNAYGRLYKQRVLPRLAASFGDLTYRTAVAPDMALLKAEHVFRDFDAVHAEDELVGTYRGLPLDIVELKLTQGSGKRERTTFDGLVVAVTLPRDTGAITAVVSDAGAFGNFRDRMLTAGRQRVRLEDPVFERAYEVYSTDQIAARTLLHPAFMVRLLAMGERPGFGRPLALAAGDRLTLAMPKTTGRNLFEAPSFRKPADSRETLIKLREDITAALKAADAVLDLDFFAGRRHDT